MLLLDAVKAGYTRVNFVKFPGDVSSTFVEGQTLIDVFLRENRSGAVRITIVNGVVTSLAVFDVKSGQVRLPIEYTSISETVEQGVLGNLNYHCGKGTSGPFALLRGAATKNPDVKKRLAKAGFYFRDRQGRRRLMAWCATIDVPDLLALLSDLRAMGCNVQPSASCKKHLFIPPAVSSPDPFGGQ
jgi:hypothetical protein